MAAWPMSDARLPELCRSYNARPGGDGCRHRSPRSERLVAHGQVGRLAGLVEALGGLVVGIQQVGDAGLQAPLGVDAVFAAQVEGGEAGHLLLIGQVVETLAFGVQAGAEA